MILRWIVPFALAALFQTPAPQPPLELDVAHSDLWSHYSGHLAVIHITAEEARKNRFLGHDYVEFNIVVDASGHVESAEPVADHAAMSGAPGHIEEAQVVEMARVFKPWVVDGVARRVRVRDYVSLLPPERYADKRVPFPEQIDLKTVRITLERTACFGSCPAYKLAIDGDGTVHYSASPGWTTYIAGEHTAHISQQAVRDLLEQFRKADFFSARDKYTGNSTDNPTQQIGLTVGPLSKTIEDYIGTDDGMPYAIRELEGTIDEMAGTKRWTQGDGSTIPSILAEHYDFAADTPGNLDLFAKSLTPRMAELLPYFLKAHTPLYSADAKTPSPLCVAGAGSKDRPGDLSLLGQLTKQASPVPQRVLSECLNAAAMAGDSLRLQFWLDHGADPTKDALRLLQSVIAAGDPGPLRTLLDHGVKLPSEAGADRDENAPREPWLTLVVHNRAPEHRAELIAMLAQAGANPNATDWMGKTPLHDAQWSVESVKPLLAAGANLEARDNQGNTPLLEEIFVEPFVRELLADGADPTVTNTKGEGAMARLKMFQCAECQRLIEQALAKRGAPPPNWVSVP